MTNQVMQKRHRCILLVILVCAAGGIRPVRGDGFPYQDGHVMPPLLKLGLSRTQCASAHVLGIVWLNKIQKAQLRTACGQRPGFLGIWRRHDAEEPLCCCDLFNVGVLAGSWKIEVPLPLLNTNEGSSCGGTFILQRLGLALLAFALLIWMARRQWKRRKWRLALDNRAEL